MPERITVIASSHQAVSAKKNRKFKWEFLFDILISFNDRKKLFSFGF